MPGVLIVTGMFVMPASVGLVALVVVLHLGRHRGAGLRLMVMMFVGHAMR